MFRRFATAGPWLSLFSRLLLAAVFAVSGWQKFSDSEGTVRSVRAFQMLPNPVTRPFGYGLPLLELGVAVLLAIGIGTRFGALISAALMVMFLVGISAAWARGLNIDCGCFGNGSATVVDPVPGYVKDLLRDIGLLAAALFLARWPYTRLSLDAALGVTSPSPRPAPR